MTSIQDAVTDTANMKAKIEQNISNLRDEIDDVEKNITSIRQQKDEYRAKKALEYRNVFELRIKVEELKSKTSVNNKYVLRVNKLIKAIEARINNQMKMVDFEQQMTSIQKKIEGALHFYSDENLHMELMKRNNSVRERRVEYTQVESEFNILKKRIDERKKEIERVDREKEIERLNREKDMERLKRARDIVRSDTTFKTSNGFDTSKVSTPRAEPTFSQLFEW